MRKPEPQVAFVAAALVMVLLPILVVLGVGVIALVVQSGIVPGFAGGGRGPLIVAIAVWVFIACAVVLGLVWWLVRRTSS